MIEFDKQYQIMMKKLKLTTIKYQIISFIKQVYTDIQNKSVFEQKSGELV